jgi:hypothetical protein
VPKVSNVTAGQSLAGYRLIELAGTGGMGRVYRAIQPGVERAVAVKVIRPDLAGDRTFRERFEVESRLVASIDHPNVIPVYGADEADGEVFVAMRWVEGRDLQALLNASGPLDPARAVDLFGQIAEGLDAAHAKGLVHRDIKPANVLLEGEHPYLTDFGLAQSSFGDDDATQASGVVGTVDYLAPELVDGGAATTASDVYALGCVLFQMLTGSVPFPVEGMIPKLHARIQHDAPAPSSLRPELPRGFDAVLARALARDPARRQATAKELAEEAREALRTAPPKQPRERGRRRTRLLAGGAVVLVAAVAALVLALTGAFEGSAHAHHEPSATASPGPGTLPKPASLGPCQDLLTMAAGDCRNAKGGVEAVAGLGTPAHLRTMDVEVTKVIQSRAIVEPSSRDTLIAPPGYRFVILDTAVTNRTGAPALFEPDQFAHRQTALYLYGGQAKPLSIKGPRFADYSEQNLPADGMIPLSLLGKRLLVQGSDEPPFTGQLVFSYPVKELRAASSMLLFVHEFGSGLADQRSVAAIKLPVAKSQFRPVYKAAII